MSNLNSIIDDECIFALWRVPYIASAKAVKTRRVTGGDFLFVVVGQRVLFIPSWYAAFCKVFRTPYLHIDRTGQQLL
jgi:hypothetical protein